MDFLKFAQFTKVQEQADGSALVFGIATLEEPDLDNEICDYDAAKDAYTAWSEAAKARTSGAGQEVSLGNIRLQHGLDIGGKAVKIEYDDDNKRIMLGSVPLNDQILDDVRKGYYTGYSQGGSYAWRKCAECGKNLTLQQANNYCPNCKKSVPVLFGLKRVSEVSYVDSPCTGKGFDYVKASGEKVFVKFAKRSEPMATGLQLTQDQIEQIAAQVRKGEAKTKRVAGVDLKAECFAYVGDPEKTDTWKLPIDFPGDDEKTKRHIRNALARFSQTKGIPDDKKAEVKAKIVAAAKKHGIDVNDEGETKAVRDFKTAVEKRAGEAKLEKGLYAVSSLASLLQNLAWIYDEAVYEREMEGDDSDVPDQLKEILENLVETFIASATEEARELAAAKKADTTNKGASEMDEKEKQELEKAAKKSLAAHFAKSAVHHEKMAKAHHDAAESHDDMCEAAKAAHKAVKADVGGEGEEKAASAAHADYFKAAGEHHAAKKAVHEKMAKAHEAHAEHLSKMAESHDKEEAEKTVKAEREAAGVTGAVQKNDSPDDFMAAAVKKAQADLLADPAFMAKVKAAQEETLLSGIVKQTVDAEVDKARRTTIAPDGVKLTEASGLRVVPRDKDNTFKLAGSTSAASDAGI